MRWKIQKQRGSKGKEIFEETAKVVKTYSTRSVEKKLLSDAMKTRTAITKIRRVKKKHSS